MGWRYQRRIRTGRRSWLNVSKRGVSGSARIGPFTVNSRGRTSFRLGRGLSYRTGCALPMLTSAAALSVWVLAAGRSVHARRAARAGGGARPGRCVSPHA